ncbi:MAG TPA: FCD domain-containing protein, partial [Egibacteraceae bacterium]|nr:FCD domain-containing protein [Egibacteraceae bacterium]
VYDVRLALELPAVHLVARGGQGQWREELAEILTAQRALAQADEREELHRLDRDFHWAIYRATGNRFLGRALTPVWSHISRAMFRLLAVESYADIAWAEHSAITEALLAGDGDGAAGLMEQHVRNGADRLLQVMDTGRAGAGT